MIEAGNRFSFTGRLRKNRRGRYPTISTGVTLGCGSTVGFEQVATENIDLRYSQAPGSLGVGSRKNLLVVEDLLRQPSMERIAGFVNRKPPV